MIKTLGLQIFTLRDAMKDEASVAESFKRMKALGYDEGHTAGWYGLTVKRYAELAKEAGIAICGTHCGFADLIADPDKAMEEHDLLGTKNIGIGGMPGEARTDLNALKKFVEDSNKFAEKVNKYGFKFTYHHHSFEFSKIDGVRMMDVLVDGFDPKTVSFVLDTYWLQHGGVNVTGWMKKLAGRVDILHLKDMAISLEGGAHPYITEIGNGNINYDEVIACAEEIGVKHYIVEQDTCPGDPFESVAKSAEYIKARYMK